MTGRDIGLLLCFALAIAAVTVPHENPDDPRWEGRDSYNYIHMARAPFDPANEAARVAPFCYRILLPYLGYAMPLDPLWALYLVSLVSLAAVLQIAYAYLRAHGVARETALLGVALLGLSANLRDPLFSFYVTDVFQLGAVMLALLAMRSRHPVAFSAILAVAVLNRETGLLLLPCYGLHLWLFERRPFLTSLLQTIAVSLPPLVSFALPRLLIEAVNDYGVLQTVAGLTLPTSVDRLAEISLRPWGIFLLLVAAWPRGRALRFVVRHPAEMLLLVLAYLQTCVAVDGKRVLLLGAPTLLLIAADAFSVEAIGPRARKIAIVSLLLAFQYVFFLTDFRDVFVIPGLDYHLFKTVLALVLGVLCVAMFVRVRTAPHDAAANDP